jgi:hypothetical protein
MLLSAFIISLTVDNKIGCAILKNVIAFPAVGEFLRCLLCETPLVRWS